MYHGSVKINLSLDSTALDEEAGFSAAKLMQVDFFGESIHSVCLNGNQLGDHQYSFSENKVRFESVTDLTNGPGDELILEFKFSAKLNEIVKKGDYTTSSLSRLVDAQDGKVYIYSQSEDGRTKPWFPCFYQQGMRASLKLKVMVPEIDWHCVTNGSLESVSLVDETYFMKMPEPSESIDMIDS